MRIGVKGETQINDQLTGYGQWEYNVQANNTESSSDQSRTRLAFAGLKFGDAGSFDYGRNYGVVYDVTSPDRRSAGIRRRHLRFRQLHAVPC